MKEEQHQKVDTATYVSQSYLRGDRRYIKELEHLWILMLEPVSLSDVLASVCFRTCDITTILLPGGAMWVFRAIFAFFMDPSPRKHRTQAQLQ